MNSQSQIVVESLTKCFAHTHKNKQKKQSTEVVAYQDLNFEIKVGEFFCILGPSGCGKSSFLRTLAGLEEQSSGQLKFSPLSGRKSANIGMVFQEQGLFPWMTVYDNVKFLLENNPDLNNASLASLINEVLLDVGLARFAHLYPHQLSGGMRQRVSIARSFANQPDILLMDEPFVFLDFQTRLSLQSLLLKIWQETHRTVVFVTHDIDEAVLLSDRVMIMTAHPGRMKSIIDIDLPRPRDLLELRQNQQYLHHVDEVTQQLRDEIRDDLQAL